MGINRRIFWREIISVKKDFPNFELKYENGVLKWVGRLKPLAIPKSFTVEVVYSKNYPEEAPKAYLIHPKLKGAKHVYADGSLCLVTKEDESWNSTYTASVVIAWTAEWIYYNQTWLMKNKRIKWPGPEG